MSVVWIVILMSLAIISAIFALEVKNLMLSTIGLILMNVFVWIIFLIFNADFLAWIQLIVYGGGLTALFLVVVTLTENQIDETFDWVRTVVAVVVVGVIIGILIGIFAIYGDSILFVNVPPSESGNIYDIWTKRPTGLIIQASLFFTTAMAIGAMFLQQKKKETKEEIQA